MLWAYCFAQLVLLTDQATVSCALLLMLPVLVTVQRCWWHFKSAVSPSKPSKQVTHCCALLILLTEALTQVDKGCALLHMQVGKIGQLACCPVVGFQGQS